MEKDLPIQRNIVIPGHELEITASRAGGPGGQHVNKTNTRITVRWNVLRTSALNDEQKQRVLQKLQSRLTISGDLIIHHSSSRSQQQNKEMALRRLAEEVKKALYILKRRIPTLIPKAKQETRLRTKKHQSIVKKMRSNRMNDD